MKKLILAMALVSSALANGCAVEAGDEGGGEVAGEDAVTGEEAEALITARDICMGACGKRYGTCAIAAEKLPEPDIDEALDKCYADVLNCSADCERRQPISK